MPVEEVRRRKPCLAGPRSQTVHVGKDIERLRGGAVDIEWAIDHQGRLYLLQVRPETVWSSRAPKAPLVAGTSAVANVLSQFARGGSR